MLNIMVKEFLEEFLRIKYSNILTKCRLGKCMCEMIW